MGLLCRKSGDLLIKITASVLTPAGSGSSRVLRMCSTPASARCAILRSPFHYRREGTSPVVNPVRPLQGGIIHSPPHGPSSGHRGIVVRRTSAVSDGPSKVTLLADS